MIECIFYAKHSSRFNKFLAREARRNWNRLRQCRRSLKKWNAKSDDKDCGFVCSIVRNRKIEVVKIPSFQPYDVTPLFSGEIGYINGFRIIQ